MSDRRRAVILASCYDGQIFAATETRHSGSVWLGRSLLAWIGTAAAGTVNHT
jgi:hypothetical protein